MNFLNSGAYFNSVCFNTFCKNNTKHLFLISRNSLLVSFRLILARGFLSGKGGIIIPGYFSFNSSVNHSKSLNLKKYKLFFFFLILIKIQFLLPSFNLRDFKKVVSFMFSLECSKHIHSLLQN